MNLTSIFNRLTERGGSFLSPTATPTAAGTQSHGGNQAIIQTRSSGQFDPRHPGQLPKVTNAPVQPEARLYYREWENGFRCVITPTFINRVCGDPATDEERKELAQIIEREKALNLEKARYSVDRANADIKAKKLELQRHYHTGDVEKARDATLELPEDALQEEYEQHRYRISCAKRVNSAKISPILANIASRISKAALEMHAKLEAQERKEAEQWGIAFTPSPRLMLVGQLSWMVFDFAKGNDPARLGVKLK